MMFLHIAVHHPPCPTGHGGFFAVAGADSAGSAPISIFPQTKLS